MSLPLVNYRSALRTPGLLQLMLNSMPRRIGVTLEETPTAGVTELCCMRYYSISIAIILASLS